MEVNLTRLAGAAEAVALKLRATGEEHWWPMLEGFAARLRSGDAQAAAELLAAIERPGGLAELKIAADSAPYVTAADAKTVNRLIRRHINQLNLLAGLAVPGSRWHEHAAATGRPPGDYDQWLDTDEDAESRQPYDLQARPGDSKDGYEPYHSRAPAESTTIEQRAGKLPRAPIDWLRVVVHGLFGAATGAVLGVWVMPQCMTYEMSLKTGPMPFIIGGAAVGCLIGAVWGHGFWDWLFGLGGQYQDRWWWWWPW